MFPSRLSGSPRLAGVLENHGKSRKYSHGSNSALHWAPTKLLVSTVVRTHGEGEVVMSLPKIGCLMHSHMPMTDAIPLTPLSHRRRISQLDRESEDGERRRRVPVSNLASPVRN